MIYPPPPDLTMLHQPPAIAVPSSISGSTGANIEFSWPASGLVPNSDLYLTRTPFQETSLKIDLTVHSRGMDPSWIAEHDRKQAALIGVVERIRANNADFAEDGATPVTNASATAASALIRLIPKWAKLPKVALDGEGGLVIAWEREDAPLLIVIDGNFLHVVVSATSKLAEYYNNLPFDGLRLPEEVLKALPRP